MVIIGVDDPTVQANISGNVGISTTSSKVVDAQEFANHIALSKAIEDYGLKRVITFHSRVRSASDFARNHKVIINNLPSDSKPLQIKAGFVSGDMDSRKRNLAIDELRNVSGNEVGILSNASAYRRESMSLPLTVSRLSILAAAWLTSFSSWKGDSKDRRQELWIYHSSCLPRQE